jgi:hypothetical protein
MLYAMYVYVHLERAVLRNIKDDDDDDDNFNTF